MQVQVLSSVPTQNMTTQDSIIQFGTSGHRGIIGEGFTQAHVIAISQAVYTLFTTTNQPLNILIGYDPRHGNDPNLGENSYTKVVVDTLLQLGFHVYFCTDFCPTPVISWAITHFNLSGGLILTASHNPPNYNGIKFNPKNGAPAPTETTATLQKLANIYLKTPLNVSREAGKMIPINPISEFAIHTNALVNHYFPLLKKTKTPPKIIIDTKYGATAKTWKACLTTVPVVPIFINEDPRSDFGGIEPNPTIESSITSLKEAILENNAILGFANDPDGDRHVIIDENGNLISPEETALIIATELLKNHHPLQDIAASVASSSSLSEFCSKNKLNFHETQVGFKHFAPIFENSTKSNTLSMGVESSGGFSLSTHTYEKCGFLPCLLVLNILLREETQLSHINTNVLSTLSKRNFAEKALQFSKDKKEIILQKIGIEDPVLLQEISTKPIINISKLDGLKVFFDENEWILFRISGTEPVARIYCETKDKKQSQSLLKSGGDWLTKD